LKLRRNRQLRLGNFAIGDIRRRFGLPVEPADLSQPQADYAQDQSREVETVAQVLRRSPSQVSRIVTRLEADHRTRSVIRGDQDDPPNSNFNKRHGILPLYSGISAAGFMPMAAANRGLLVNTNAVQPAQRWANTSPSKR